MSPKTVALPQSSTFICRGSRVPLGLRYRSAMSQGLAIALGCLAVVILMGIPTFLFVFFSRRHRRVEQEMTTQWTGTVIEFEYDTIRAHDGFSSKEILVVKVLFRRQDGSEGSFRVAERNGTYARQQNTGQPLQPSGLYEEIDTHWNEGDAIEKASGEYYPRRVPKGRPS